MKILKKRQRTAIGLLLTTTLLLTIIACNNELETTITPAPGNEGKVATFTAKLSKDGAQTRIDFNDEGTIGVKATWSKGDQIMIYGITGEGEQAIMSKGCLFTLEGDGGAEIGNFTGILPEGTRYTAYYPASKMPEIITPYLTNSMLGQEQSGNGDMKHLSAYNFISSTTSSEMTLIFTSSTALLTFDLTMPLSYNSATDGIPNKLEIAQQKANNGGDNGFIMNSRYGALNVASMKLNNIKMDPDNKLVAYLMIFQKSTFAPNDKIVITVTTNMGKIYSSTQTMKRDITYSGNKRYTATIDVNDWNDLTSQTFSNETIPASGFTTGDGSDTSPYLITNASELKYFIEQANTEAAFFTNKHIELATDIYVTADTWTPIGDQSSNSFNGNFNGNGHTIYGKLHAPQSSHNHFGFFGFTFNNNIIKNLNMNAEVKGGTADIDQYYTGSVLGYSTSAQIENCHNYGKVTGGTSNLEISLTGGIVGTCKTLVECSNHGEVTGGKGTDSYTGGIAGGTSFNDCTIKDCMNDSKITAGTTSRNYSKTGGIAGTKYSISHCTNYGEVTSPYNIPGFALGGIIGYSDIPMHSCLNVGIIKKTTNSNSNYGGGLVGYNDETLYSCNIHTGTVLEDNGTLTPKNPTIGYSYLNDKIGTCTEVHTVP